MISPQYVDGLERRIKELTAERNGAFAERDAMEMRARAYEEGAARIQAERDTLLAELDRTGGES